jgi:hypothetical protein
MWLIIILVIVLLPLGYMIWRFKQGDESVAGGSAGNQIGGGDDEDWGPHSD